MKRRRRKTNITQKVRRTVLFRAKHRCERCGDLISDFYSIHHRKPRGMGSALEEINQPSNLMLLCGSGVSGCHGWVESNRKEAMREGFLVSRYDDPCHVPVITPWGLTKYLSDDGGIEIRGQTLDAE
jgi:hypothetical protein